LRTILAEFLEGGSHLRSVADAIFPVALSYMILAFGLITYAFV
jgi:hypothetical protein